MRFQGKVAHLKLSPGSKSEHSGIVLLTENGPLKLRRPGGNPFHDDELEKLVGSEIECDGEVYSGNLLMTNWGVRESTAG